MDTEISEVSRTIDNYAHQTCYVYQPLRFQHDDIDGPPRKKLKLSQVDPELGYQKWPRLCNGQESERNAELRKTTFCDFWNQTEKRIEEVAGQVDLEALERIQEYVRAESTYNGRLQTGLITSGPNSNPQKRLSEAWKADQVNKSKESFVVLQPSQAPNLQMALKNTIRTSIETHAGTEDYFNHLASHKRLIPMNFDLELLQKYIQTSDLQKVIVAILDVEAFDIGVLSDFLSTLSSWTDRIHFSVLLGIATTVELFESRLPKSTIRCLNAKVFEITLDADQPHKLLTTIQDKGDKVFLGPSNINVLAEMIQDSGDSSICMIKAVKYSYMSHFFANPLTVLLSGSKLDNNDITNLCEVIRNTDSFQTHCEQLLQEKKSQHQTVRKLLENDHFLYETAKEAVTVGQQKMCATMEAFRIFQELYRHLKLPHISAFDLEVMLYQSVTSFESSEVFDAVISAIQKLRSDALLDLATEDSMRISGISTHAIESIESLHANQSMTSVRSTHDPSMSTSATSISQNKISLTKSAPKLTGAEQQYTKIIDEFVQDVESYFINNIVDPMKLFMNEAFIHNFKSPLSTTLYPRPRYALERAFVNPGDYLSCECCSTTSKPHKQPTDTKMSGRSNSSPPTSLLYTLLTEAGAIINVRDLWDTFRGILLPETDENDDDDESNDNETESPNAKITSNGNAKIDKSNRDRNATSGDRSTPTPEKLMNSNSHNEKQNDERRVLAIFYRSLAELKMMGLVKQSKRKPGVECIMKTTWTGL